MKTQQFLISSLWLFLLFPAFAFAGDDWKVRLQIKLPAVPSVLAYSSDRAKLAVGHKDGKITVWDVSNGAHLQTLDAKGEVNSLQFTPDGALLFAVCDDKHARFWQTSDWREKVSLDDVAFAGGISPDGKWFAAQDAKQTIWLWDLARMKRVKKLTESGIGGANTISFTPDNKFIVAAHNRPLVINIETKEQVKLVMSGDKKSEINIQPTGNNQVIFSMGKLEDDDAITHNIVASRTGSLIALGRGWYGKPAFVDVWDINAMKRIGRYKPKDCGTLASFSFDNSLLAVEGAENVTILQVADGKQTATVKGNGLVQFAPQAMELAVTNDDTLLVYTPK